MFIFKHIQVVGLGAFHICSLGYYLGFTSQQYSRGKLSIEITSFYDVLHVKELINYKQPNYFLLVRLVVVRFKVLVLNFEEDK